MDDSKSSLASQSSRSSELVLKEPISRLFTICCVISRDPVVVA